MTKVINFYAGPGAGKSSTASDLFAFMKWKGESVELVQEFAKDLTWDEHFDILADQLWVSANQNRRMQRLVGKVDYIITDSPLIMCQVYAEEYFPTFLPMIAEIHNHYENIDVFLERKKPYVAKGRSQSEEAARLIDGKVHAMMNGKFDLFVEGDPEAKYTIYNHIKKFEE